MISQRAATTPLPLSPGVPVQLPPVAAMLLLAQLLLPRALSLCLRYFPGSHPPLLPLLLPLLHRRPLRWVARKIGPCTPMRVRLSVSTERWEGGREHPPVLHPVLHVRFRAFCRCRRTRRRMETGQTSTAQRKRRRRETEGDFGGGAQG